MQRCLYLLCADTQATKGNLQTWFRFMMSVSSLHMVNTCGGWILTKKCMSASLEMVWIKRLGNKCFKVTSKQYILLTSLFGVEEVTSWMVQRLGSFYPSSGRIKMNTAIATKFLILTLTANKIITFLILAKGKNKCFMSWKGEEAIDHLFYINIFLSFLIGNWNIH